MGTTHPLCINILYQINLNRASVFMPQLIYFEELFGILHVFFYDSLI